jgi:hypothetical protein
MRARDTTESEEPLYISCGCIWQGNVRIEQCSAHSRY